MRSSSPGYPHALQRTLQPQSPVHDSSTYNMLTNMTIREREMYFSHPLHVKELLSINTAYGEKTKTAICLMKDLEHIGSRDNTADMRITKFLFSSYFTQKLEGHVVPRVDSPHAHNIIDTCFSVNSTLGQREHVAYAVISFAKRDLATQGWGYDDDERCWYRLDV